MDSRSLVRYGLSRVSVTFSYPTITTSADLVTRVPSDTLVPLSLLSIGSENHESNADGYKTIVSPCYHNVAAPYWL